MEAVFLTEMYVENLKKHKKSYSSIYCVKLLEQCIKEVNESADESIFSADFFKVFFVQWLPYNVCQEDDDIIEGMYVRVRDFCRFCDRKFGTHMGFALNEVGSFTLGETKRVMYVKKNIMEYIKSPVINKSPVVIDLDRYRLKAKNDRINRSFVMHEKGYFKVADIFTNNSVVLKKISGYTFFIRVYFDKPVIEKIRLGDVLDIKVRKADNMVGWKIEDISGCLAREKI